MDLSTGYLADACALIVFMAMPDPERLMPRATAIMRTADVLVAGITVWEITRKASLGKLPRLWTGRASFSLLLRAQGFHTQPLGWEEAEAANALPDLHKDPMDRLLIATALRHDLTVLTEDAIFTAYGVTTVW